MSPHVLFFWLWFFKKPKWIERTTSQKSGFLCVCEVLAKKKKEKRNTYRINEAPVMKELNHSGGSLLHQ